MTKKLLIILVIIIFLFLCYLIFGNFISALRGPQLFLMTNHDDKMHNVNLEVNTYLNEIVY